MPTICTILHSTPLRDLLVLPTESIRHNTHQLVVEKFEERFIILEHNRQKYQFHLDIFAPTLVLFIIA